MMTGLRASLREEASRAHGRVRAAGGAAAKALVRGFALDRQLSFWMGEVDPAFSLDEVRARVVAVVDETHDVKTFLLAPNRRWAGHRAGQFVTVAVEIGGVRTQRCYSVSSSPGPGPISITVKRVPGGRVSSWMHDHLAPGAVVGLGPATGDFVLDAPSPEGLLLVSGGSGVTPVMSILRHLDRQGPMGDVVFIHGARSPKDIVFRDELLALSDRHPRLRLSFFLDDGPRGRLDAEKLVAAVPDFASRRTYLCGPPPMMAALEVPWVLGGVADRLKTERFAEGPRPSPRLPGDRGPLTVSLVASGRAVNAPGEGTLLEELERGGAAPAFGCRQGICNTCLCRKRSGVVENVVSGALSTDADEDIRLCISRARTDVALDL